jgi:hypothetical protein
LSKPKLIKSCRAEEEEEKKKKKKKRRRRRRRRSCDWIIGLLAVAVPSCGTLILYSGIIHNLSSYSLVSIQNSKGERSNVGHVCGMRLRIRSTAD